MKTLKITLSVVLILAISLLLGCSNDIVNNTELNVEEPVKGLPHTLEDQEKWDMNAIGLNDVSVNEVHITSEGILYALAEGNIYEVEDVNKALVFQCLCEPL